MGKPGKRPRLDEKVWKIRYKDPTGKWNTIYRSDEEKVRAMIIKLEVEGRFGDVTTYAREQEEEIKEPHVQTYREKYLTGGPFPIEWADLPADSMEEESDEGQ